MRKDNWQDELVKLIERHKTKPFKRGYNDCALFAGKAVYKMTGNDYVTKFLGKYKTKKASAKIVKELGYKSLSDIADKHLDPYTSPMFAKRGDCVLVEVDGGEALAIVDMSGRYALTTGKDGLVHIEMKHWQKGWAV